MRYYFNPGSNGINWFAGVGGSVLIVPGSGDQLAGGLGVGFLKRMGDGVALQVVANYARIGLLADDNNSRSSYNSFGLTAGYSAYVSRGGEDEEDGGATGLALTQRRGAWLVGGQALTFAYVPREGDRVANLDLRIAGLRMINTRFAVGGSAGLTLDHFKSEENSFGSDFQTLRSIVVHPAARIYFSEGKRTGFLVQAGVLGEFSNAKSDFDGGTFERTTNRLGASIYPALAMAVGRNVALEVGPEVTYLSAISDNTSSRFGYSLQVGLQYTIGGQ